MEFQQRIDFHNLAKPGNLANSAVLRMLEEEERSGRSQDPYEPWIERFYSHIQKSPFSEVDREKIKKWSVRSPRRIKWFPTPVSEPLKMAGVLTQGLKRVAWPPPPEEEENTSAVFQGPVYSQGPTSAPEVIPPGTQAPHSPQLPRRHDQPGFHPIHFEPPKATVTLRSTPPVNQVPAPVYQAQPPVASVQGGTRMRGDQKWPPENVKQQTAAENEARLALAKGPAFRPRKVKKDYSSFFAQHALNSSYPGYRAPPGTQHYMEGASNL